MKIISVVGFHHSGKTTTCEYLIKYIRNKGFTVSTIKDIHNENFTMETVGSNSYRHLVASGTAVFARSKTETYLIWQKMLSLHEMLAHLDTDYVIIEGHIDKSLPCIISAKTSDDVDSFMTEKVIAITGQFSENVKEYNGIVCANAMYDGDKLGDFIYSLLNISDITS